MMDIPYLWVDLSILFSLSLFALGIWLDTITKKKIWVPVMLIMMVCLVLGITIGNITK